MPKGINMYLIWFQDINSKHSDGEADLNPNIYENI